jgi:membrane peptidoglycan carboxypeptidase
VSSRDFNGPYQPAGGRGADDYAGGGNGAGASYRDGYERAGSGGNGNGRRGDGWGDDGYWRDSASPGSSAAAAPWDQAPATPQTVSSQRSAPAWPGGNGAGGSHRGNGVTGNGVAGSGFTGGGYAGQTYAGDVYGRGSYGAGPAGAPGGPNGPGGPGGPNGPGGPGGPGRRGPGRGGRGPGRRSPGGRRQAGPRGKIKGSWWRRWTWKKALAVVAAGAGVFLLLIVGMVAYFYSKTQIPTAELATDTYQQSTVYFADGKGIIGKFGSYDRQDLTLSQIAPIMQDAALAAEDRNFYHEGGISPTGIMRAAYEDITGGDGSLQGGSTITQEFVRQYYAGIGTQQTMSRKIKEIFVAMKIGKEESKQWILQQYLNVIYLGDGAYGIGAAAQTYFNVSASKLDAAQAAVIAAIIQSPTYFPLPQYHSNLVNRWHYVLNGLVSMGDLTQAQVATMKFPKMNTGPEQTVGSQPWDPYILGQVQSELTQDYGYTLPEIENDGLKIYTTISEPMTTELYDAVNANKKLMAEDGGALPSYALIGAELQDPNTGAILAEYPGRGQNMTSKQCLKYDCDDNTVAYAREQVGSSFKPYVVAEAVREGMNVQTSTLNGFSPLWVPPDQDPMVLSSRTQADAVPGSFVETNDSLADYGPMTVQNAFAQSSDTAFTDLIHRVGTANVVQLADQMGVNIWVSGLHADIHHVGMALGQDSLTVNEQNTMLSTLANGGTYHQAHVISKIVDPGTGQVIQAKVAESEVLTQDQDSQVQYAMSTVVTDGTGTAAELDPARPIIAKTGTTNNAESAFFIGAIPQASFTVGIWTQNQTGKGPETLNGLGGSVGGGFGGYWPARIWNTFMQDEYGNATVEPFLSPVFTGSAWNQVGKLPSTKKTHHKQPPVTVHHHHHQFPTPPVTTSPPTGPPTSPPASPSCGVGTTIPCTSNSFSPRANGTASAAATVSGAAVPGAVVGGVLAVLPGTLLWNRAATRRRRKAAAARARAYRDNA